MPRTNTERFRLSEVPYVAPSCTQSMPRDFGVRPSSACSPSSKTQMGSKNVSKRFANSSSSFFFRSAEPEHPDEARVLVLLLKLSRVARTDRREVALDLVFGETGAAILDREHAQLAICADDDLRLKRLLALELSAHAGVVGVLHELA